MRQFHIKPPARGVSGWPARLVCMMLVSIVCHAAPENRDIDNAFVAPWELTLDDMNENVFELVHNESLSGVRVMNVIIDDRDGE